MTADLPNDALGTVSVKGLRLIARHGVATQERVVGNEFEVDVELRFPAAKAMCSDDIAATVSYAEVVDIIKKCMQYPSALVEHVVYRIYTALSQAFPIVVHGSIAVYKLHPPIPAELDRVGFLYAW